MLQLMDEKHYQKYVTHFPSDKDLLVSLHAFKPRIELVILLTDCQTSNLVFAQRIWSSSFSQSEHRASNLRNFGTELKISVMWVSVREKRSFLPLESRTRGL